jgi:hypothetical protein
MLLHLFFFGVDRKEKVSSSSRIAPAEKGEGEREKEKRRDTKKKAFIRHYHSIVIVRSFGVISVDELGTGMSDDFVFILLRIDEENIVHDACVK